MARGPFETRHPGRTRLLAFLSILIVVGFVLSWIWIINPDATEDELIAPADAIVVFPGGDGERLMRADELRELGLADFLVLPGGSEGDWEVATERCAASDLSVICPERPEATTKGAAKAVEELREDREWQSVIMVTATHHITRAGLWLEQASQRMHKNKLAAALANKLARIAWSILRHGGKFDTHRIETTAI